MNNYGDIINNRVGLISYLEPIPFKYMGNTFHRYMANIKSDFCDKDFPGTGFASDIQTAQNKAIGEAIERYSATIKNPKLIVYDNYENLEYPVILPTNFNRYNDSQYLRNNFYEKFNPSLSRSWVEAIRYLTGEKVYVPFETVYLLQPLQHKPFRDIVSTGLACGTTFEHAFENGLAECVERDAFLWFWLTGLNIFEIEVDGLLNTSLNVYFKNLNRLNLTVNIYDISQPNFKIFTILTVIRTKGTCGFYTATSSSRNLLKAIKGSIEEAISGYTAFKERISFYDLVVPNTLNDIKLLEDHAAYYVAGKHDSILEKILPNNLPLKTIKNINIEYSLEEMVESINKSTDILYIDITPIDVEDVNLKSLRVITPQLLFLSGGNEFLLESERLNVYAKNQNLNLIPHSFP